MFEDGKVKDPPATVEDVRALVDHEVNEQIEYAARRVARRRALYIESVTHLSPASRHTIDFEMLRKVARAEICYELVQQHTENYSNAIAKIAEGLK